MAKRPPWKANCSHIAIARYWCGLWQVDLSPNACFACGASILGVPHGQRAPELQRAHVFPVSIGGWDAPDNVLILCRHCHVYSESRPPAEILTWVRDCANGDCWAPWPFRVNAGIRSTSGYADYIRSFCGEPRAAA